MLELVNMKKSLGGNTVVAGVSLTIREGEFFSLLGPSGCGKTTLLRMIAGLESLDAGEIRLNGEILNTVPPHHRPFHMVFQRYALFPHLSVFENIAFGLRLRKISASDVTRQVDNALQLVRMEGAGHRDISTLSGGQQQRVALARALVNKPRMILLDEPLSALDLKLRLEMQRELRGLQRQLGMTFIYVTHDQEEALTLSDRIGVMNQGSLLQIGSPQEIYSCPTHPFVATFLGSINVVDVDHRDPQTVLMVRPEHLSWTLKMPPDRNLSIPVTIDDVVFKGQWLEVMGWPRDQRSEKVTCLIPGQSSPETWPQRGQEGWFSWSSDKILTFALDERIPR